MIFAQRTTYPAILFIALCIGGNEIPAQQPGAGVGAPTPPQADRFRFERAIAPGGRGPNRLDADVPLLLGGQRFIVQGASSPERSRAVGGLGDLRLFDSAGREVPHLLVMPAPPPPKWLEGRMLPVAPTDTTSGFEVDLGGVVATDALQLDGLPAPFLKRVRLEGSGDRSRWTVLVSEGTLFDLPGESLRATELGFDRGEYRYLRVTWDDQSSGRVPRPTDARARLTTASASVRTLREQVVFERRPSEPGKSRYRIHLPGPRLPIIALELSVDSGNVLRDAEVTEARLVSLGLAPARLGRATLRRAVRDGIAATSLRIPIIAPTEAVVDLVVDDGDNQPLALTRVHAVFATLPFIYFESDGAGLVARYGAPTMSAPRYDLEAIRDSVPTLALASAAWGQQRDRGVGQSAQSPRFVAAAGANVDQSSFQYSRTIEPGPPGLATLSLDTAVLAHSGLTDLRIITTDRQQVPYLLETLAEPYEIRLPTLMPMPADSIPSAGDRGPRSFYRLRLPYPHLPPARLVLETSARVFQRRITIELVREPTERRRERWRDRIVGAEWTHADPDTPAPPLTLSIPTLNAADIIVAVEEGDNSPLPIAASRLLLPAYRLRFFREGGSPATLYYGSTRLGAPRYDIELIAPRLVGADAEEAAMGEERQVAPIAPAALASWAFWAVLGAAVVGILVLIARLIKQTDEPVAAQSPPASSQAS